MVFLCFRVLFCWVADRGWLRSFDGFAFSVSKFALVG